MVSLVAFLCLAQGQTVEGTVRLSNGRPATNAVVALKGREKSSPLTRAVVDQRDRRFSPHVSVVTVGTTVQFPNNDTIFHNVFSEYHSQRFDLGTYARGRTKPQTFDRPGLAVILCSIHPDMSAYIMVVDTPFYALTDKNGHYRIGGVPRGSYQLQGWHESGQKYMGSVQVGDGTIDLGLKK